MIDTGQTGYAILHEGQLWINPVKSQFVWQTTAGALNSFGNTYVQQGVFPGSDKAMTYYERKEYIQKEKKKLKVIKVKLFMEAIEE